MTVVVERSHDTVEVFFGLPAEGLVNVFDLPPDALVDDSGLVAFEPLRLGTWDIGDNVIASVQTYVGDQPTTYEAMSLMVHPEDQRLPLYDAMDGFTAIAVCAVEPPETPTLDSLYAYIGYIAYPDDPMGALRFALPATGRDDITVEMRDFRGGQLIEEQIVTLPDGGEIAFAAMPEPSLLFRNPWLSAIAAAVFIGMTGAAMAIRSRTGFRPLRSPARRT